MATVIPYDRALPEVPGRTPYTKPDAYLEKLGDGDYAVRQGRRPSTMFLVEKLRTKVDEWRRQQYKGASAVTKRLFQFWFEDDHLLGGDQPWRYWWCQREAVETLVYLTEIRGYSDFAPLAEDVGDRPRDGLLTWDFTIQQTMDGQRLLERWVPEERKQAQQDLPEKDLLRYAFKMATGSGKTIAMAMLVTWAYLSRRLGIRAPYLADNFLIIAPNVIVFERLKLDFASNTVFHEKPLFPPEWEHYRDFKVILRGDSAAPSPSGTIILVNIQRIHESREKRDQWTPQNAVQAILGQPPKQDLAAYQPSMLERIKSLNSLMVINDEAHHVHDDDLQWNQTLLALHQNLKSRTGRGLALWLDFSATPKTQRGSYYPWIVADYPLAQAVEDHIVKAPLIVHRVDADDPTEITRDNVVQAYHDWIVAALERWKTHTKIYEQVGQKPVLFIMAERTAFADAIAEHIRRETRLSKDEVLVIHTDRLGALTREGEEEARRTARDVNLPGSKVKIIVSVLMLREGWDVKNVTVVLGLRPMTAAAEILPEQTVGRGLRPMQRIGPDQRQTLEVIGTQKFEEFVRQLEHEGVGIDTVSDPPPQPLHIYPVQDKAQYDIALPLTRPLYRNLYRNLRDFDPMALPAIYDADVLDEVVAITLRMDFATTGTTVHEMVIIPDHPILSQDFLRDITQTIERNLDIHGRFAELYGIVKRYVQQRCFGVSVDLESDQIRNHLREPMLQQGIVAFLGQQIADMAPHERTIEFENAAFRLSQTPQFLWHRRHCDCQHSIFNATPVYNNLEERFARFLDNAADVLRFCALAESYTKFRVDYLSARGAIRFYYPDFVAVQSTSDGEVNWIFETKGQEDENVVHKDASIKHWCDKISAQTGQPWRYQKVQQTRFYASAAETLADLLRDLSDEGALFVQTPEA